MSIVSSGLPPLKIAESINDSAKRIYIAASGFEERALGWCQLQVKNRAHLERAYLFRYLNPKGPNKVRQLRSLVLKLGRPQIRELHYDLLQPQPIESLVTKQLRFDGVDEVIVDISAMTKLLILLVLYHLRSFEGTLRIVYCEADEYCPSKSEYDPVKHQMASTARIPSHGVEQSVRLRCMSSIRMQGQPVSLIAFTSFNEKLISHMLGANSPHRLLLINGRPPRPDYNWREYATYDIHRGLCEEYRADNPEASNHLLERVASTLDYRESIKCLEDIYSKYGLYERIACAATGSKMQTVALFFFKMRHPDVHVEYPTPDSYFVKEMTIGVRNVHEITIPAFKSFLNTYSNDTTVPHLS